MSVTMTKTKAPKAPKVLTGKKLKDAIAESFRLHGNSVPFDIFDLGKIDREVEEAYKAKPEQLTIDLAMAAAVAKYRKDKRPDGVYVDVLTTRAAG